MNSLCNHLSNMSISEEKESCCICLDELEKTGITTLDCGHTIHLNCFMEFILCGSNKSNNNKCPLCRTDINMTNEVKSKMENVNNNNINKEDILFATNIQQDILFVLKSEPDYSYTPQGIQDLIIDKFNVTYEDKSIRKNCDILYEGGRLTFMRGSRGRHMYGYDVDFLNI